MEIVDYDEFERRQDLPDDVARQEIEAKIADCANTRGRALSLRGYSALDSLTAIAGFGWIEEFDCVGTSVSDLTPLAGLNGLTSLNCSGTSVSDLAPLAGLRGLTSLNCSGTSVSDLAPLADLSGLTSLTCSGTSVSDLAPLAGLIVLSKLQCSLTLVSDLMPVAGLAALTELDCSNTAVSDLTPVAGLSSLTKLYCSHTAVSNLVPVAGLTALTEISCSNTAVADLSPLADLRALTEFDCSYTSLSDLAPLRGLIALTQLRFGSTTLSDLSPLADLTALTDLDCSDTSVSELAPLAGLIALEELNCSSTSVSDLAPLAGLTELTQLQCRYTSVSDLAPLSGLRVLDWLDCESTAVADLSPLVKLSELTHLDCSQNAIKLWPRTEHAWPSLEKLIAVKARIEKIPGEDLSQDYGDNCLPNIQAYFADFAAGAEPLERSKIIILGNGQVGKTQLRRWLLDSSTTPFPFDASIPSTHGIEVMRGPVALPTGEAPIDASLWDFGGQDIYHGTHSLFMKTRAIFVLCWCPQQEDNREQLLGGLVHQNRPMSYWVDYVRQLAGPENPLIIVQTQCDSAGEKQPSRFADVDFEGFEPPHFIHFSARQNLGGAALREAIGEAANAIKDRFGVPLIGAGRKRVLDQLEAWRSEDSGRPPEMRQHKLMTQADFAALCDAAEGISSPPHLLNFLHHAGVIFYRKGLFDDRIILDQDWALAAIYAVFNRDNCYKLIKRMNGRFYRQDLADKVWQAYGIDEQRLFLSMMQSCGIAFTHYRYGRDDDAVEYIAPELLPERAAVAQQIERGWHGGEVVEARLRYGLLHHGLIRQILARIGDDSRIFGDYWQTGMLFYERTRQSDAMIEALADADGWGGEIVISCRNGRASELLGLLTEEVTKIGNSIGMSPDKQADSAKQETAQAKEEAPEAPPLSFGSHPSVNGTWYVSYAWGDNTPEGVERDSKVNAFCDAAEARGIKIVRDRDTIGNGDSIRRFMEALVEGDRIVAILSDKYLHSPNCMFELFHAWQKQQANPQLFARAVRTFRLPCAKFGKPTERGAIAKHWAKVVEDVMPFVDSLGSRDLIDYQLTKHFALNVGDILYAINDTISPRDWDAFLDWAFASEA